MTTNQLFTFSSGQLASGLVLNANGGILFNGNNANLTGATLNNAAGQTATMNGSGGLVMNSGAIFNNNGTFLAQNNAFFGTTGGGGTINNAGTFTRDTGTGTFLITGGLIFNNSGTVNVNSGGLRLNVGDSGSTPGDFNVAAGATLEFRRQLQPDRQLRRGRGGNSELFRRNPGVNGTFTAQRDQPDRRHDQFQHPHQHRGGECRGWVAPRDLGRSPPAGC